MRPHDKKWKEVGELVVHRGSTDPVIVELSVRKIQRTNVTVVVHVSLTSNVKEGRVTLYLLSSFPLPLPYLFVFLSSVCKDKLRRSINNKAKDMQEELVAALRNPDGFVILNKIGEKRVSRGRSLEGEIQVSNHEMTWGVVVGTVWHYYLHSFCHEQGHFWDGGR